MLIWNAWALIPSQFPHPWHSFLPKLGWWELALFVPQTSAILALALPHPYQGLWPAPWREMSDISASLLRILRSFWLSFIVPSVQPQLPSDSCQMSELWQVWLRIHVTVSSILSPLTALCYSKTASREYGSLPWGWAAICLWGVCVPGMALWFLFFFFYY